MPKTRTELVVRLALSALLLGASTEARAQVATDEDGSLVHLAPGEGLQVQSEDETFSLTIRALLQLWLVGEEQPPGDENAFEVRPRLRRARLIVESTFYSPDNHLVLQLGFSPDDFPVVQTLRTDGGEVRYTPIVDAFLRFTQLRDMNVAIGRQLLPFIRERVVSSAAMSLPLRSMAGLDFDQGRLYGVEFGSDDVGGIRRLAYRAGAYMQGLEDANRPITAEVGGRLMVHLLRPPNLEVQGDLERSPTPRLTLGAAYAWEDDGIQPGRDLVERDLHLITGDLVFRMWGLAIEGAVMYRRSTGDLPPDPTTMTPAPVRDLGAYALVSYVLPWIDLQLVARWSELWDREGDQPNERELTGGLSYHFFGTHPFKLQLAVSHLDRRDPEGGAGWRGILMLQAAL